MTMHPKILPLVLVASATALGCDQQPVTPDALSGPQLGMGGGGPPASLAIVAVSAPAINCKFDTDCTIFVTDFVDHFTFPGATGEGFLQSRLFPVGEPGTAAEGLYGYDYRIDLRNLAGGTGAHCVSELRVPFGPIVPIDYDDDGNLDDVYVVTEGGLGTVLPSAATRVGVNIIFSFDPAVCSGVGGSEGETTFFFGLASARSDRAVKAWIDETMTGTVVLDARAPQLGHGHPGAP
jgi:hypothetical protein